jgi:membrane-bound lytic murein transglycosylase B
VLLILGAAWGGVALHQAAQPPPWTGPPPFVIPPLTPAPQSAIPATTAVPEGREAWIAHLASTTDLPRRALRAYADAEVRSRSANPGCHITWATMAGIGREESHHGNHGSSEIGADGVTAPPIFGIPLDGSPGLKRFPDTDGGTLDGDPVWDRAMGPMQFLPKTWREWGLRASGDGARPDPQNIDDAALTTTHYLCGVAGNLATPGGWWNAILTYNTSVKYAQEVFSNADAYARAALKP